MEKFTVEPNRIVHNADNKLIIVFDVLVGGIKVGESEKEYLPLVLKLQELVTAAHSDNLKTLVSSMLLPSV